MRTWVKFSVALALTVGGCGGDDAGGDDGLADDDTGADTGTVDDDGIPPDPTVGADDGSTGVPPPVTGIPCSTPFDHEGFSGCIAHVADLDVKFFPLDAGTAPTRLAVFFHGDTGADWIEDWGFSPLILQWAADRDILVLGFKAPIAYPGENVPSYGAAQPDHADMLAGGIEAFIDAYAITADRSLYWGVSGGSWFFTSSFIAAAGHRVPGVFVANCGGAGGSFGWAWDPMVDVATRDLNALYLNYGDLDFLAEPSAASYTEFMGLGFVTDQLVHPGAMHCDHPIAEPTLDFWELVVP